MGERWTSKLKFSGKAEGFPKFVMAARIRASAKGCVIPFNISKKLHKNNPDNPNEYGEFLMTYDEYKKDWEQQDLQDKAYGILAEALLKHAPEFLELGNLKPRNNFVWHQVVRRAPQKNSAEGLGQREDNHEIS